MIQQKMPGTSLSVGYRSTMWPVLDWDTAIVRRDTRNAYGEDRYQALTDGFDGKPYVVVFTMRDDMMWIISFRRAHAKERRTYGKKA